MDVLIVRFHLEGMTDAEYRRGCDEAAAVFRDVPGLLSKTWLADPATSTYGGVYLFRDRTALDAYLASDLCRSLRETPAFAGLTAEVFGVLDGPSRVTHVSEGNSVMQTA